MGNNDAGATMLGARARDVRILIENSEYWLRNNGDLAMMAVTVARLRARWPQSRIAVLTDSPSLLRAYFPDCEAITVFDDDPWGALSELERLATRTGPGLVGPFALTGLRAKTLLPQKSAGAVRRLRRAWRALAGDERPVLAPPHVSQTAGSFAALESASLLVCLGGGYLTDADPDQTNRVLNLIEQASRLGVPVAMVGQGLGPIEQPELRARAAEVLPGVASIALREKRRGPTLLTELGVAPEKVHVTGDDAIELAYNQRSDPLGTDIGFCVRIADYSPVTASARATLKRTVQAVAAEVDAQLAPLIIAEYKSQDRRSTMPLVKGYPKVRRPLGRYAGPRKLAARVSHCRVMVTGAYHLAVFALSQGIPVVGLTTSVYYDDKFLGLADMFETGFELVDLRDSDLENVLGTAIRSAWKHAPELRDPLCSRAREQISDSRAGFDRLVGLVDGAQSSN